LEKMKSHSELNEIETVDKNGTFKLFVTTKEEFMRGLDFRARKVGMVLVIN